MRRLLPAPAVPDRPRALRPRFSREVRFALLVEHGFEGHWYRLPLVPNQGKEACGAQQEQKAEVVGCFLTERVVQPRRVFWPEVGGNERARDGAGAPPCVLRSAVPPSLLFLLIGDLQPRRVLLPLLLFGLPQRLTPFSTRLEKDKRLI